MISRLKRNYFVSVVTLKKQRHVLYNLDEVLSLHFSNTVLKILQKFENATFPLVSMVN